MSGATARADERALREKPFVAAFRAGKPIRVLDAPIGNETLAIEQLRRAGITQQETADIVGMSRQRVHQILTKDRDRRLNHAYSQNILTIVRAQGPLTRDEITDALDLRAGHFKANTTLIWLTKAGLVRRYKSDRHRRPYLYVIAGDSP